MSKDWLWIFSEIKAESLLNINKELFTEIMEFFLKYRHPLVKTAFSIYAFKYQHLHRVPRCSPSLHQLRGSPACSSAPVPPSTGALHRSHLSPGLSNQAAILTTCILKALILISESIPSILPSSPHLRSTESAVSCLLSSYLHMWGGQGTAPELSF